jgi:IPT/TIG domain
VSGLLLTSLDARSLVEALVTGVRRLPDDRPLIFVLQLVYLGGLGALAGLYFYDAINPPDPLGTIPLGVPWFGALGAVVVSLTGIFDHAYDWDPGHRLWHISRPFIGAAVGIVVVLFFQAGILAVGSDVKPHEGTAKNLLFYALAFTVGYGEENFRDLMKRVATILFSPGGQSGNPPAVTSISPATGPLAGGEHVVIAGSGFTSARTVSFGAKTAPAFIAHTDSKLVATTPPAEQPGAVAVSVRSPHGSAAGPDYTYTQ